jgi:hypothetical protein
MSAHAAAASSFRAEVSNRRYERRDSVRWVTRWTDPDGRTMTGDIYDVSSRGIFLRPSALNHFVMLPAGTRIGVEFYTPGGSKFTAQGTLRWVGYHRGHACVGFGIEFDATDTALRDYLRSL